MVAQSIVSDIFVAADALPICFAAEVTPMGAKRHAIALRRFLQVFMAVQASGVIDKLFAAFANAMPIDLVRFLQQFHGRVHHTVLGLDPEVMQGVVMGEVTVITGGPEARRIIASVNVFAVGPGDGLIGMTAGTEFIVAGSVKGSIHRGPAGDNTYPK